MARNPALKDKDQPGRVRTLLLRWLGPLFLLIGVPILAFAVFAFRPVSINTTVANGVLINIASGEPLVEIAQQLSDKHVVADPFAFRLLVMLSGKSRNLQAGIYRFHGANTPLEVLQALVAGRVELITCTFAEGLSARQVARHCARLGLGKEESYIFLINDAQFCRKLSVKASSLEGYLYPETYSFAPGSSERTVLRAMVDQTRRHLDDKLLAQAKKHGLNEKQLLTLASVIQKEAGTLQEMPLISAVFHNRLKRRMPLQADPTVIYGIRNFNGNLTRRDLLTPGPYNTYLNRGLPPGPIANPGMAAIRAAANPANSSALYFVADGSGGHKFSNTLAEHNRAVRLYQLQQQGQVRGSRPAGDVLFAEPQKVSKNGF